MKLKKIYRVIRFEQNYWMMPYNVLNAILRTAARDDFQKDVFKVMNNSVFGKTIENIRKNKEARDKPRRIC